MDAGGRGRDSVFPSPLTPYSSSLASSSLPSVSSRHASSMVTTSLPILVLTVLGILTTSALLLTYYVFVIRCCLTFHATSDSDSGSSSGGLISISISRRRRSRGSDNGHLPVVVAPPPCGLREQVIQALPVFRYNKATKSNDASECAVCLGEFMEEETVRLLPNCLHVFHVDCIDTWLQGNANCPLCRAAIANQLPSVGVDRLQRPEEVVIQMQVATDSAVDEGTAAR
ncbi:RING-H2 finger protein ATL1 [Brachypodium distachyon]|uniref:RING-H2 finger protein ATL1 n=1 Tax=Brachypodium distachyon TaxID=15368 RepID=UPI00052FF461|nr:RING-H2 finger protein ATL1 [Brachypodium distachyon]|eukprot:XP_010235983.1 RING-H2 finger protein ATL1 [Brachypodium distachyon]